MLSIFSYVSGPSVYVFLGEVCVQVFCAFFNWVVCLPGVESCESSIYFGVHTLVWDIIGKYVFPYSWFSFHFNVVSLAMQKLFSLMRSHFFILSFMSLALGDISVKMLLCGMSETFLPVLSWRTFMVSRLIFKSFIHLQFIFVYGVSWWSSFTFLHVAVQLSHHHLLKRLFFCSILCFFPLCQILIDHRDLSLFLGSLICSIGLPVFMPLPGCFD